MTSTRSGRTSNTPPDEGKSRDTHVSATNTATQTRRSTRASRSADRSAPKTAQQYLAGSYVAVRGHGNEVWVGRLQQDVRAATRNTTDINITWLEWTSEEGVLDVGEDGVVVKPTLIGQVSARQSTSRKKVTLLAASVRQIKEWQTIETQWAQQKPASDGPSRRTCPLRHYGCDFTSSQLQRMVTHLNTVHSPNWTDPGVQRTLITHVLEHISGVHCCPCGTFYATTGRGLHLHRAACQIRGDLDSLANMDLNNLSAMPRGITRTALDPPAHGEEPDTIIIAGKAYLKVDKGHELGKGATKDTRCCFYKACTRSDTAAAAMKQRLTPLATALALEERLPKDPVPPVYGAKGVMAQTHCIYAHAHLVAPMVVASRLARQPCSCGEGKGADIGKCSACMQPVPAAHLPPKDITEMTLESVSTCTLSPATFGN